MILDPNDPTGVGLFSKCGRNHASKFKSQRTHVTNRTQPKIHKDQPTRKKIPVHFSFDKQESRQQREKKYKNSDAPPVGHYHPTQKKKPKLIWDILKVYNSQTKPNIMHQTFSGPTDPKNESNLKLVETINSELEAVCEPSPQNNLQTRQNNMHTSVTVGDISKSGTLSKSQCMVNMSRMTGRKDIQIQSIDWGEVDIMKSVSKMKGHISKNIYFDRQPRQKARKMLNYSASYNCNYDAVKPRKKGLVNFSIVKGRQSKMNTSHEYSYQHYNYNSYVWQQYSRVYPNTKTHLISFDKQKDRYARSDRNNSARQQETIV